MRLQLLEMQYFINNFHVNSKSLNMRLFFVVFICLLIPQYIFSQSNDDATFLSIGKQKISTGEFERIYNKNNSINSAENQSVDEYLQMFVNFKLKVQSAIDAGLDTLPSFKNELKGYRDQLAKSYLTDNKTADSLIREAYQRMHSEVSASHIMVSLNMSPSPEDTIVAWKKIMGIRQRLINGEDFEKLASDLSSDPSAKNNKGNLGYFTSLQLPYPIESAIYNNKIGEISLPVRSTMGYHLIKTTDKRPARGEIKVAHIMLMVPQGSSDSLWLIAEKKIKGIEQELKAGGDFANIARERSEDRGSAKNGGELPAFGAGRMVPEFDAAAFKLNNPGEISEPVRTFYGWHIIKLIEKSGIPEFEKVKQDLKSRISRDERSNIISNSFTAYLKNEYKFEDDLSLLTNLYSYVQPKINATKKQNSKSGTKNLVLAEVQKPKSFINFNIDNQIAEKSLIRFADQSYELSDFIAYLKNINLPDSSASVEDFIRKTYNSYVENKLLEYTNKNLELSNTDFKNLVQEYHDGILLFNMSDSLVWSKASLDSTGLTEYFTKNQNSYIWPVRFEATVVSSNSPEIAKKALIAAKKLKTQKAIESGITKAVCDTSANEPCIQITYGKFSKGENEIVDSVSWKKGISKIEEHNDKFQFVIIHNVLKSMPKKLEEIKGLAISDYQNYLDSEWVNKLRKQYQVVVNDDILNELKNKYAGKK